ncbi:MAG: hypothetical protein A3I66_10545 [Burkholderiales bacterium RIFCSPLOWO2_02_FULL_57_36]|nr:MAG: hypothetical protein A3I66_10545 [Burkholderiales bacterium RIFCSPLOWO2_02_FULL_57_36]
MIFSALFLIFLATATLVGKLPASILGLYLTASAATFIVYATDKSAAKNDQWRTRESTLHFLGLIGGWPGAAAAQSMLRHKSRKQPFRAVFWFTVVLNCSGLAWMFTSAGSAAIQSVLGAA